MTEELLALPEEEVTSRMMLTELPEDELLTLVDEEALALDEEPVTSSVDSPPT